MVHNDIQFKCFVGSRGIGKKTREGDKVTPIGTFEFSEVYYRPDRVKYLKTSLPLKKINKTSFWCVDPKVDFITDFKQKKITYAKTFTEMTIFMTYSLHLITICVT